jgi:hypothetical protein
MSLWRKRQLNIGKKMTITLTREEAQQVLDAIAAAKGYIYHNVLDDKENQYDKAINTLRARLAQPECVCGEPDTAGVHRQDGPCYQQPDSELKVISTGVTHIYSTGAPVAQPELKPVAWKELTTAECKMLWRISEGPRNFAEMLQGILKEKNAPHL